MLSAGEGPCSRIRFDAVKYHYGHGALVFENSTVSLIPKLPRDEHDEGGHGFPSPRMAMDNVEPPRFNVMKGHPIHRFEVGQAKPIFDHVPNPQSEAAMEEEMSRRLGGPITKGAITTIRPPTPLETIRCPNPVLDDKP